MQYTGINDDSRTLVCIYIYMCMCVCVYKSSCIKFLLVKKFFEKELEVLDMA